MQPVLVFRKLYIIEECNQYIDLDVKEKKNHECQMHAAMYVLKLGNEERSSGPIVIGCSTTASYSSSCSKAAPSSLPSSKSYSGSSASSITSSIL